MRRAWVICLTCLFALRCLSPGWAQRPRPDQFAFVIICDASNTGQLIIERRFADAVKSVRSSYGLDKATLPIFTYHFDNAAEKHYCEQTLGVHSQDLVYIGIATRKGTSIEKMVSHSTTVSDPETEGVGLFKRACAAMGLDPKAVSLSKGGDQPDLGAGPHAPFALHVLDAQGRPTTHYKTTDQQMTFSVTLGTAARTNPRSLTVAVFTPSGRMLGATPLGGPLSLSPDLPFDHTNALLLTSSGRIGYPIRDSIVGARPGIYRATASLDGVELSSQTFTIDAEPEARSGQLGLLSCYLLSGQGVTRTSFTQADSSVAVVAVFTNLTPGAADQRHTVLVEFANAVTGQPASPRRFGGEFSVAPGEDLTLRSFPMDADPEHTNGASILSWPNGAYKAVVRVDGQVMRELPFTIGP